MIWETLKPHCTYWKNFDMIFFSYYRAFWINNAGSLKHWRSIQNMIILMKLKTKRSYVTLFFAIVTYPVHPAKFVCSLNSINTYEYWIIGWTIFLSYELNLRFTFIWGSLVKFTPCTRVSQFRHFTRVLFFSYKNHIQCIWPKIKYSHILTHWIFFFCSRIWLSSHFKSAMVDMSLWLSANIDLILSFWESKSFHILLSFFM